MLTGSFRSAEDVELNTRRGTKKEKKPGTDVQRKTENTRDFKAHFNECKQKVHTE